MEFIKRMKKREFIEMGLKTLAALLAAFLVIILMEGMIYAIELNALKTKGSGSVSSSAETIVYCIKEDDDQYFVLYYNESHAYPWQAVKNDLKTKAECDALKPTSKDVIFRAPTAFEFTITPVHYAVMGVFVGIVAGFFVYKFIALANTYKKIEDKFQQTGVIEIG